MKNGKHRIVKYLPYPVNYGMIPRTLSAKEKGGDGDPLDVLLLGPAKPRGEVTVGKLVGVLKLLDEGKQDDKLLAVSPDGPFGKINSMEGLRAKFAGVPEILETWFENYKGPGKMKSQGFAGRKEAEEVLDYAITNWH